MYFIIILFFFILYFVSSKWHLSSYYFFKEGKAKTWKELYFAIQTDKMLRLKAMYGAYYEDDQAIWNFDTEPPELQSGTLVKYQF